MTTISLTNMHGTYTISIPTDEVDIGTMREDLLVPLLHAVGYATETITELFAE